MSKIKISLLVLATAFTFGACASVEFSGAAEGVDAGSYYLTAKPISKDGDSRNAAHKLFKCTATSELEWSCGELAVTTVK